MSEHDPFAPVSGNLPTQPAASPDSVPSGTRAEIMDWVGSDKNKARKALTAESSSEQPRKTLIAELKDVVGE